MTLYENIKEYLIDEIGGYENQTVYGCDLADLLTNSLQINGTVEFCTKSTIEKIAKNHWEYGEVYKYMEDNYGKALNPLESPEAFDAQAYYIVAGDILGKTQYISEHWNEEIELTSDVIKTIQEQIEEDTEFEFSY